MAFKGPGPGRPPGMRNKATLATKEHVARLGVDPIEFLASVIKAGPDDGWSLDHKLKAAIELASYVAPKLKAVEHSVPPGTAQFVIIGAQPDATAEEWEKRNNPEGVH